MRSSFTPLQDIYGPLACDSEEEALLPPGEERSLAASDLRDVAPDGPSLDELHVALVVGRQKPAGTQAALR